MAEGPSDEALKNLNNELSAVQRNLSSLREPAYSNNRLEYGLGNPDHPEYEMIELDLGTLPPLSGEVELKFSEDF